jgi:hypothetical protein
MDQMGIGFREGGCIQSKPFHDPGTEGVEQDVGCFDQGKENGVPFGCFQVECETLLAAVEQMEERALTLLRGVQEACPIAPARSFNLDHLRTEIRKDARAVGPGQEG